MSNSDLPVRFLGPHQSWPPEWPGRCWGWSLSLSLGCFTAWIASQCSGVGHDTWSGQVVLHCLQGPVKGCGCALSFCCLGQLGIFSALWALRGSKCLGCVRLTALQCLLLCEAWGSLTSSSLEWYLGHWVSRVSSCLCIAMLHLGDWVKVSEPPDVMGNTREWSV